MHVSNILAKLRLATRVEAAAIAHRSAWVMPASAAGSSMRGGHCGGVAVA